MTHNLKREGAKEETKECKHDFIQQMKPQYKDKGFGSYEFIGNAATSTLFCKHCGMTKEI